MQEGETPKMKGCATPGKIRRSPSEDVGGKRRKANLLYNTGKNFCCMTNETVERAKTFGRMTSDLKVLLAMKKCVDKDLEDPTNFPRAKMALTVVRIGSGPRQAWGMIEEAKKSFNENLNDRYYRKC